jgi:hypothetical protein
MKKINYFKIIYIAIGLFIFTIAPACAYFPDKTVLRTELAFSNKINKYHVQTGIKQGMVTPKFYDLSEYRNMWAQIYMSLRKSIGKEYNFSPVVQIMSKDEFELLSKGAAQRGKALVRFLQDIYGGTWNAVKEGVIPEAVVEKALETQGYKELVGKLPPSAIAITYGPDLYYHNGYVIEDNIGDLGGRTDIFKFQEALADVFPGDAAESEILEKRYIEGLKSILPAGEAAIAYWEDLAFRQFHDFSSDSDVMRDSGVLFAGAGRNNGNKFEVDEHEGLFVITPDGKKVKIGFLNYSEFDFALDPGYAPFGKRMDELGYNKISNGIPGIVSLVEENKLLLGHCIGSSLADSKLIYPFVEKFIKFYLNEEPVFKAAEVFALNDKYGFKQLAFEDAILLKDRLVIKPIEGEEGKDIMIGRSVDNSEWAGALKKAFNEPDNFLLFEYVEPLRIDDYVSCYRPIVEIMPDLRTNVYPGVYARTKNASGDGVIGFGRQDTKSMIVVIEGISILKPVIRTLADLEKEWQAVSSRFSADNARSARRVYTGDTFLDYGINKALKAIIREDILRAQKADKKLTYIISCGQYEDTSWLVNTLMELIPESDRHAWSISLIITNLKKESLDLAASAINDSSVDGLPINTFYLNINVNDRAQVKELAKLFVKHDLYGIADGIMHNMGGSAGDYTMEYFRLFRNLAKHTGWLEVDRYYIPGDKKNLPSGYTNLFDLISGSKYEKFDKLYLKSLSNVGFTITENGNNPYAIFRILSPAQILTQKSLQENI